MWFIHAFMHADVQCLWALIRIQLNIKSVRKNPTTPLTSLSFEECGKISARCKPSSEPNLEFTVTHTAVSLHYVVGHPNTTIDVDWRCVRYRAFYKADALSRSAVIGWTACCLPTREDHTVVVAVSVQSCLVLTLTHLHVSPRWRVFGGFYRFGLSGEKVIKSTGYSIAHVSRDARIECS